MAEASFKIVKWKVIVLVFAPVIAFITDKICAVPDGNFFITYMGSVFSGTSKMLKLTSVLFTSSPRVSKARSLFLTSSLTSMVCPSVLKRTSYDTSSLRYVVSSTVYQIIR